MTQAPIHGVSFAHTLDDAATASGHRTQYFEMFGHRAIDHDGWRAVRPWPGPSFAEAGKPFGTPITAGRIMAKLGMHLDRETTAVGRPVRVNAISRHQYELAGSPTEASSHGPRGDLDR